MQTTRISLNELQLTLRDFLIKYSQKVPLKDPALVALTVLLKNKKKYKEEIEFCKTILAAYHQLTGSNPIKVRNEQ